MSDMINEGQEPRDPMEYDLEDPNCPRFDVGGTSHIKKKERQIYPRQEVQHSQHLRMSYR